MRAIHSSQARAYFEKKQIAIGLPLYHHIITTDEDKLSKAQKEYKQQITQWQQTLISSSNSVNVDAASLNKAW